MPLYSGFQTVELETACIGALPEAVEMNGRFQMQGGKNWFLPKEMNANRFFWDSHWLEIWSNHFYPSMGPNGGSVAMDSGCTFVLVAPANIVHVPPFTLYGDLGQINNKVYERISIM